MNDRSPRYISFNAVGTLFMVAILIAICSLSTGLSDASAHAELVSSDPPINGLVVSSPEQVTLTFTEEVETSDPAPEIVLLDQDGTVIGSEPLPVATTPDPRSVVVTIPGLDRGTYTVSWTVTSGTDAHTLSGTYAFRVGGGLPPGQATSEGEAPAAWAVSARWITFLGASVAVGMLLFGELLFSGPQAGSRWRDRRARLLLGGAIAALAATLAEPLLQWVLSDSEGDSSTLGGVIRALPDGWWWRPAMLIPLAIVGIAVAYPLRGAISRPIAWIGSVFALGSLLGLVMTSHAAGRSDGRVFALASDALHQWSVALWCGGLVALVLWASSRPGTDNAPALRLKRFSTVALGLFVMAVITGVINAGFVFEILERSEDHGWTVSTFDPLWTSNYGIVLLVKTLVLLIPLGLAIYHRSLVAKFGQQAASIVGSFAFRFRRTLRWELGAVAFVILGGSTIALSSPPPPEVNAGLDQITLVSSTTADPEPDSILVHLTIDPAQSGENAISARLTDWNGKAITITPTPGVALDFSSLDHGTVNEGVNLQLTDPGTATYVTAGLDLSLDGWWKIDARVTREGTDEQVATFYSLLPDPNTQGFGAPPKPDTDLEAEDLFDTAYAQMLTWQRVRWTETLGTGGDVMVRAEFAVVDGGESGSSAYSLDLVYSGGFAPQTNGEPPAPPTFDSRSSITVGDRGWLRTTRGDWLDEPPTRFSTPAKWDSTYAGSTNFRMGITEEIDGRKLQVVTFFLPAQPTQAEAWFTWWIDTESGDVVQIAMIARQHYMVWNYTDINGKITIEPPRAD